MIEIKNTLDEIFDFIEKSPKKTTEQWLSYQLPSFIPDSYADMVAVYYGGYAEGVIKISEGLNLYHGHKHTDDILDVVGDELDVAEHLAGMPEQFYSIVETGSGTITEYDIEFNCQIVSSCNFDDYTKNCGVLLGIVQDIEKSSAIKVNLSAVYYADIIDDSKKTNKEVLLHKIKLNKTVLSDIAIIAHPSFIRRIVYGFHGLYFDYESKNGRPIDDPSVLKNVISREVMTSSYSSEEGRESAIKAEVKRILSNQGR